MKQILLAALLVGFGQAALAQAPGTGGPTPQDPQNDPTQVPLDSGASLLLAGGLAYGLKHLHKRRSAR